MSYRRYEEARGAAHLAALQAALLAAVLLAVFPLGCWLLLQGVEPRVGEEALAPARLRMGIVLLGVTGGVLAPGLWSAVGRLWVLGSEKERLRFLLHADEEFPPAGGAAALRGEDAAAGPRAVSSREGGEP